MSGLQSGGGNPSADGKEVQHFWPTTGPKFKAASLFLAAKQHVSENIRNVITALTHDQAGQPAMQMYIADELGSSDNDWKFASGLTTGQLLALASQFNLESKQPSADAKVIGSFKPSRNKALQVMSQTLKLSKLSDPCTVDEDAKFAKKLAEHRGIIRDHLVSNGFSSDLGIAHLKTLLGTSKRMDLQAYTETKAYKDLLEEKTMRAFDRAIATLTLQQKEWNDAWQSFKNKTYQSLSALWTEYAILLTEYPEKRRDKLEDLKELLPRIKTYDSIRMSLKAAEFRQPITDLTEYRRLISMLEKAATEKINFNISSTSTNIARAPRNAQIQSDNICWNFTRTGSCRFGNRCKYLHESKEGNNYRQARNSSNKSIRKSTNKTPVEEQNCRNFWKGQCDDRDCKRKHLTHEQISRQPLRKHCAVCYKQKQKPDHVYCNNHYSEMIRFTDAKLRPAANNVRRGNQQQQPPVAYCNVDLKSMIAQQVKDAVKQQASVGSAIQQASRNNTAGQVPSRGTQSQGGLMPTQGTVTPTERKHQRSFQLNSFHVPAVFPVNPFEDERCFANICGETVLLDTGGQASICGISTCNGIRKTCQHVIYDISLPVSGIGKGSYIAKQGIYARVPGVAPDGTKYEVTVSLLVCEGYTDEMIIGIPDLKLNSIEFLSKPRYHASLHNTIISTIRKTSMIGSVRIKSMPVEITAIKKSIDVTKQHGIASHRDSAGANCSEIASRTKLCTTDTHINDASELITASDEPMQIPRTIKALNEQDKKGINEELKLLYEPNPLRYTGKTSDYFKKSPMIKRVQEFLDDVSNNKTYLSTNEAHHIVFLLSRFQHRFVERLPEIGGLKGFVYSIKNQLTSDKYPQSSPFKLKEPKLGYMIAALENDVKEGLRFIPQPNEVKSTTPCFPIFERDKMRIVGNFTALNNITELDQWPCPTVAESTQRLSTSKYVSTFDAKSGYHQIKKDAFTIMLTVWITLKALYATPGMDFGLKNAGQTFVRAMHTIFECYKDIFAHVDDLYALGNTFQQMFRALLKLFTQADKYNLFFKLSKIQIARRIFKALGHMYCNGGYKPDPSRLSSLMDIAPARTVKQCQSMLGLFVFWSKFIPNLQKINEPIRRLIRDAQKPTGQHGIQSHNKSNEKKRQLQRQVRKSIKVKWTPEAQAALIKIRDIIVNKAFLAFPDYTRVSVSTPFDIFTDACDVAMGYVLVQNIEAKPHLLKCGSKVFLPYQQRYHINRKEMHATCWALEDCSPLIALQPTRVNFDSKNIDFYAAKAMTKLSAVWSRYSMRLQSFPGLQKRFIRGSENIVADLFNRYTVSTIDAKLPDSSVAKLFPGVHRAALEFLSYHQTIKPTETFPKDLNDQKNDYITHCKECVNTSTLILVKCTGNILRPAYAKAFNGNDALVMFKRNGRFKWVKRNTIYDYDGDQLDMVINVPCDESISNNSYGMQSHKEIKLARVEYDYNPASALIQNYRDDSADKTVISFKLEGDTPMNLMTMSISMAPVTHMSAFPNLVSEQKNCTQIQSIVAILKNKDHARHAQKKQHFNIVDNVLYNLSANPDPKTDKRWMRVVVPMKLRDKVFKAYHEQSLGCHYGYVETLRRILKTYHWPGIRAYVKKAVKECDVCLRVRKVLPPIAYVTPSLPLFGKTWSADYVGPFPKTSRGETHMLTFVERSTTYPEAYPTVAPDARCFAKIYCEEIIPRHGMAQEIITDLGSHFMNSVVKHINTRLGSKHITASSGNSRGNSVHERQHRPITAGILANLVQKYAKKGKWRDYIGPALFALRNLVSVGKDYSPNELLTGRCATFPADLNPSTVKANRDLRLVCRNVEDFFEKIQAMRDIAAETDIEFRTAIGDKKFTHNTDNIVLGSFVWLHSEHDRDSHNVRGKLDVNWIGPYIVVELISPNSFILQHSETGRKTKSIHRRHIAKAHPPAIPVDNVVPDRGMQSPDSDSDTADEKQQTRPTRRKRKPSTFAPMIRTDPQWQEYIPDDVKQE